LLINSRNSPTRVDKKEKMGITARRESNLKLEVQKIKDFAGTHKDWQKWKSRTECAFSGSGYEKVLENARYAMTHTRLNKIVFSQLAASTVDGTAYHLVQKYKEDKNGHAAWINLREWYDGETIKSETATSIWSKLENLHLHPGISGSEYVNKFMAWYRDLEKIKREGMSASHVVSVFLRNVTDTDYQTTVTY
jgi:hypothetical protein